MAATDHLRADGPAAEREKLVSPRATLANAALALGLLAFPAYFLIPGGGLKVYTAVVIGLAAGVLALTALLLVWTRPSAYGGKVRAVAGMILGLSAAACWRAVADSYLYLSVAPICQANLRGIAYGLRVYHEEFSVYPADLQALVTIGQATPWELQCPFAGFRETDEPDYVYVVGLGPDDPADWILAYDDPANHLQRPGANILYLSGEVRFLKQDDFIREFKRFREAYIQARGQPPKTIGPSWP